MSTAGAPPTLLSDAQVKAFIRDGMLLLPIKELPTSFHEGIWEKCGARWEEEAAAAAGAEHGARGPAMLGRFMFGELPELTQVLESPSWRGALTSLLGPGYVQHPHRTMHTKDLSGEGGPGVDQGFHKDGHHIPVRNHFPRWLICFYYPKTTTVDMGPTSVIAGSHL